MPGVFMVSAVYVSLQAGTRLAIRRNSADVHFGRFRISAVVTLVHRIGCGVRDGSSAAARRKLRAGIGTAQAGSYGD